MDITWVGYELHPERSPEGDSLSKVLPGVEPQQISERFNQAGSQYGLVFNPVEIIPNTKLALMATEYAKEIGKFEEFHDLIFRAYFTESKNISLAEVITPLLVSLGVEPTQAAQVLQDEAYARRVEQNRESGIPLKIAGLPTFIFEGQDKIVGAQTYQRFKQILSKYC